MPLNVPAPARMRLRRSSIFPAPIRSVLVPFLIGLCLSVSASAQPANIAVGSASGIRGATATIPVTFTPGETGVSTLQFDLKFSSPLVYGSAATGPAASTAFKSASSSAISGGARILVFGLNQNTIGSGVIANIEFSVSAEASVGTFPIEITGIIASDTLANPVATEGTGGSVKVFDSELVFPRFSAGKNFLGPDTMSGIGLVNLDPTPGPVTFIAVEENGSITDGQGLVNPVEMDLDGNGQLPVVDSELFGDGILDLDSNGYIKLERANADTSGFFLIFDADLNFQDGANLSGDKSTDFVFSEIQTDGYNKISIINNNPDNATLTIDLVRADGRIRRSLSKVVAANGSLTADLFGNLFLGFRPYADDYVRVKSSIGVHSFQVIRQNSGDMAMLAGQDLAAGGTTLYSPIYAIGDRYGTSLSVINLDSVAGTVSLRLLNQDGIQVAPDRVVGISANGKLFVDDPGFFADLDLAVLNTGYLEIEGNGIRLLGSTVFADLDHQSFCAALALISGLQDSVLFSHVVSNDIYFTGIAILNPAPEPALVTLELYDSDGTLRESRDVILGAQQRWSRLASQYFSSLAGRNQTSGYVRLSSSSPIAAYAAFGTHDMSMISAIPPQIIH